MELVSLSVQRLTSEAFAPFGDVIETGLGEIKHINWNITERHHALASTDMIGDDALVLINIFRSQPWQLPITIKMLERHPLGSQAFMPLNNRDYFVVVAEDRDGQPQTPVAFLARGNQGVNYHRNVWHHPLLAQHDVSDFLVVDRGGAGNNLEEHYYPEYNFIISDSKI
ncbi:ureidoglycolate lyase [Pseudochrobactrum sp. MP213Fo]|uniref:ureidoglycolate lyase n=1 Tax=Pseudochrobactrum sp. MP213Fo TaxID=3022250 RepID=UPI003BA1B026